jgi:hypothetical protein
LFNNIFVLFERQFREHGPLILTLFRISPFGAGNAVVDENLAVR